MHDLDLMKTLFCNVFAYVVKTEQLENGEFIDSILGLRNVSVNTCKLEGPDESIIELLKFETHPNSSGWNGTLVTTGLTHIAFTVENLKGKLLEIESFGGQALSAPLLNPEGTALVCFVRMPENLFVELVQPN